MIRGLIVMAWEEARIDNNHVQCTTNWDIFSECAILARKFPKKPPSRRFITQVWNECQAPKT